MFVYIFSPFDQCNTNMAIVMNIAATFYSIFLLLLIDDYIAKENIIIQMYIFASFFVL